MTPKSSPPTPARRRRVRVDAVARPPLDLRGAPAPGVFSSQSRRDPLSLPPSSASFQASTVRTLSVRSRRSRSSHPHLEPQAWELLCRIGVNLLFTTAAITGLYRLLPVQLAQYHRLQLLEQEIEVLGMRLSRLQEGIDRSMDPMQQEALIKERLNRIPPNQMQVRLVDPSSRVAEEDEAAQRTWIGQSPGQLPGPLPPP